MGKEHTTTYQKQFHLNIESSIRVAGWPTIHTVPPESKFSTKKAARFICDVKNTHTTSQIPFSGSPSNWVEGFNYNHLRKNKYPFFASLPHYTPHHSLEQTDSSFHWFHSTLKIRLSPPTPTPPRPHQNGAGCLSGGGELCVISLMWKLGG